MRLFVQVVDRLAVPMRHVACAGLGLGLWLNVQAQMPRQPVQADVQAAANAAEPGRLAALDRNLVLLSGPGGGVSLGEVMDSLQDTVAPEARDQIWRTQARLGQLANSIYRNKTLAAKAKQANVQATEPEGHAPSEGARTRFWAEAYMRHMVMAAVPKDAVLTQLAKTAMLARPAEFRMPADKRVRHIMLAAREADAAVEAKAQDVLKQLQSGADFAALAKQSDDKNTADKGGELGWMHGLSYPDEFQAAVAQLNAAGQLSPVVRTSFGYHVIQLEELRAERAMTEAEATEVMREQVFASRNTSVRRQLWEEAGQGAVLNEDNLKRVLEAAIAK